MQIQSAIKNRRGAWVAGRIPLVTFLGYIFSCWILFFPQVIQANSLVDSFKLDASRSKERLTFMASSPHPFGSERQEIVKSWLVDEIKSIGLNPLVHHFKATTPSPSTSSAETIEKSGYNVFSLLELSPKTSCLIGFGSHYDTKDMRTFDYLGANDSGSSSILLLELMRYLHAASTNKTAAFDCNVVFIFFDGEESVLPNWNDGLSHKSKIQDNTYGSRAFVSELSDCLGSKFLETKTKKWEFKNLLLLDMIGLDPLKFTPDSYSDRTLKSYVKDASLYLQKDLVATTETPIADDHVPFKEAGITVLNLIDFHHLDHWHTPKDRVEFISYGAIETAGKVALYVFSKLASSQKSLGT